MHICSDHIIMVRTQLRQLLACNGFSYRETVLQIVTRFLGHHSKSYGMYKIGVPCMNSTSLRARILTGWMGKGNHLYQTLLFKVEGYPQANSQNNLKVGFQGVFR